MLHDESGVAVTGATVLSPAASAMGVAAPFISATPSPIPTKRNSLPGKKSLKRSLENEG